LKRLLASDPKKNKTGPEGVPGTTPLKALRAGLRDLGYGEGKTIIIE
jgi:hypothetical protein